MMKCFISMFLCASIVICLFSGCSSSESSKPNTPVEFSLSEYSDSEIEVAVDEWDSVNFYLLPFDTTDEDLEIVNSDNNIAECNFWTNAAAGNKICIINIKGLAEGVTTVYLKDKNSTSESARITITVFQEEEEEEEVDNSRTVYINLNGDKYHYSKECAGKSAQESTLNKVIRSKEPCSKCVH